MGVHPIQPIMREAITIGETPPRGGSYVVYRVSIAGEQVEVRSES